MFLVNFKCIQGFLILSPLRTTPEVVEYPESEEIINRIIENKHFEYYLKKDGVLKYKKELEEYKQYFLDNCIIFNYGMMPKNILLRKNSETDFDLVLIDGLGDVTYFTFPNKIPYFARRRINRRWDKFIKKYL